MSSRLASMWRGYWFEPAPLVNLATVRIVLVAYQLHRLLRAALLPALIKQTELPTDLYNPLPILRLMIAPVDWRYMPSAEVLEGIFWLTVIFGVLALVGLLTNLSLVVFTLGNVFMRSFIYSFGDYHHPEALVMIALGILALSPSGGVLSLDSLWQRLRENARTGRFRPLRALEEKSAFARWPLLLVMWVFALIFLSAAYSKLRRGGLGLDWVNGYTLQYYLISDALRGELDLGFWLGHQHFLVILLSWFTLIFEATFFLVLVFPILAWIYVPAGIGLFLGFHVAMGATFFGHVAAYSVWVSWRALFARLGEAFQDRQRGGLEIRHESEARYAVPWLTFLSWADCLQCLRFVEVREASSDPSLVPETRPVGRDTGGVRVAFEDGTSLSGIAAWRAVFRCVPLLWPPLALSYVPGAPGAAESVYGWFIRGT